MAGYLNFLVVCCSTARELLFMSTLQELWYGNIRPNENKVITNEEKRLVKLMARHQDYLRSKLNDKELDEFQKYILCVDEYTSLVECQAFEIGFKLAVKILTETN